MLCHCLALIVVTMWGSSFVCTKVLVNHGLGAVEIFVYRITLAYFVILATSCKKLFANSLRDEALFLVCGLCGGSIYFISENTAVMYTRVSDVSMITTLSPLLTTLLIGVLYKAERPGMWTWISSVIAFMGVGLIVFKDGFGSLMSADGGLDTAFGDMLALGAAFSWAIYSVVLRKLNVTYTAKFVTRKTFFYGLLTALPFWIITPEPIAPFIELIKPEVLLNLLFLGLVCSLLAYTMWAVAMGGLGAITTNNYLYVQPIVTMIIAAILFDNDPLTLIGCVGAVMVIGGLWFGDFMEGRKIKKS